MTSIEQRVMTWERLAFEGADALSACLQSYPSVQPPTSPVARQVQRTAPNILQLTASIAKQRLQHSS